MNYSNTVRSYIRISSIFLIGILWTHIQAQKYDFNWMLGYDTKENPTDTFNGGVKMNFENWELNISAIDSPFYNISQFLFSASTEEGEFIFHSNGLVTWNKQLDTMYLSQGFNYSEFQETYWPFGLPMPQGGLFLPFPGSDSLYYLFHMKMNLYSSGSWVVGFGDSLFYSIVDMKGGGGLGEMADLNILLSSERFYRFGLTATRHANGRDWWILMPELYSNRYWTFLLDPTGVNLQFIQEVGEPLPLVNRPRIGQAVFSPNGEWYVRNSGSTQDLPPILDIYRFDRVNGSLSEHVQFDYVGVSWAGGVAISSNSRFIYATQGFELYQFDLESENIEASKILIDVYDGFDDLGFSTTFYQMQLAPDGKIYMVPTNGIWWMHTIHNPNHLGRACDFRQHDLRLPRANSPSIPNNPNFRLGPIDGSIADTLGIDNVPLAAWHYQSRWREVEFIDNSFYEPTNWSWTFGDGMTSADTSPTHVYADTGTYHVCLTISNAYGADTFCRDISVVDSFSSTFTPSFEAHTAIYPNPAGEMITLQLESPLSSDYRWELYSSTGALVHTESVVSGETSQTIRLDDMASGLYFWRLSDGEHHSESRKLVIMNEVE